jgi:serine-type D-Ala-D-Ala carboxypeptidase (penicillin-binding protein 5/6)
MQNLFALAFAFFAVIGCARAEGPVFETAAKQAILIDYRSGAVFFEKGADELMPPASMSKLMTMVLVFEGLKSGKLTMDQEFAITEDAWRRGGSSSGGSTMYAELNSRVALRDLIQGVIVQSANDACIAIADGIAGSEPSFAEAMTRRARELGLTKATFKNATGLPDPDHKMTVRELSILAQYIIRTFPEHFKYYSQRDFEWNKIKQPNRNPLLADYPGADGMKTGYTKEAGYGLVGTAERDGRRLIMVIAGLESLKARKEEAQKLLDWGFRQFKSIDAYAAKEVVARVRVWGGAQNWVDLATPEAVRIMLSPQEQREVEVKLAYIGPLLAPVKSGDRIGTLRFLVQGKAVTEAPLFAVQSVDKVESMWSKAWDSILIMALGG